MIKLLTLVLLLGAVSAAAEAPPPPSISDQHPLALFHLSPRVLTTGVTRPGSTTAEASFVWSNTINHRPESFYIDAETRVWEGEVRHSFRGIEAGLRLPLIWRGEGATDHFIKEWDNTLGVPNKHRNRLDGDQYHFEGETEDGTLYQFPQQGLGLGSMALTAKAAIKEGAAGEWSSAIFGEIGLPTAANGYGHDSFDLLAAFAGGRRFGRLKIDGGGALTYFNDVEEGPVRFERYRGAVFASFILSLTEKIDGFVQCVTATKLVENIGGFADYNTYVDFGAAVRTNERSRITFLVRENPGNAATTTDVTVAVAGSVSF